MAAALVGMMAFRQEEERPLRGLGVFVRGVAAKLLKALPVNRFFGLLFAFLAFGFSASKNLHVVRDHADACLGVSVAVRN